MWVFLVYLYLKNLFYFPFLGIDSAGKNQLKAVTQGLAALIVCQVEELKSSDDMKLLEKSMLFLTEKCVEFCVKKINRQVNLLLQIFTTRWRMLRNQLILHFFQLQWHSLY